MKVTNVFFLALLLFISACNFSKEKSIKDGSATDKLVDMNFFTFAF